MATSLFSRHESHQRRREKIRNNPELIKKYRTAAKKSYRRNKLKILAYQKNYRNEMREVAISIGNCSFCFKEKDNPRWKMCTKCRIMMRKTKDNRHKKTDAC